MSSASGIQDRPLDAAVVTQLPPAPAQPSLPLPRRKRLWNVLVEALRPSAGRASRRRLNSAALFYAEPSFVGGMADWWGLGTTETIYDAWPSPAHADAYALSADWRAIGEDLGQAATTFRTRGEDMDV